MDRVFWTNSGSESGDTALKIALAYHRARGEAQRTRLVGRERGYHGVGFGGMSVGGIGPTASSSAPCCPTSTTCRTPTTWANAFTRGLPEHGADLADALEHLVALHGADTIAAVMVEPVAGSTGVLVAARGLPGAPARHLHQHGILLIFDEVITGFGRLGHQLRRRAPRRRARHHDHGQGPDQRRRPHGRRRRHRRRLRRHRRRQPGRDRAVPRLHLSRPPARLRRRHRHHGPAPRRGPARPRRRHRALLAGRRCTPCAACPT